MSGELAKNVRRTLVVHSRYALRSHRMGAALDGEQGLLPIPLEHLVARLAGGFLQPVNPDDLKDAVAAAIGEPLGELDAIKDLPGFQRAATASLSKAWSAGLSLDQARADDAAAQARIDSLAILEREVLARLPDNQLRPWDLAAAAERRMAHAGSIFGRIEIRGRTGMSRYGAKYCLVSASKPMLSGWQRRGRHQTGYRIRESESRPHRQWHQPSAPCHAQARGTRFWKR